MNLTKLGGGLFRMFVYLFLLGPLAIVVFTAFSDTNRVVFPPRGFTLEWFHKAVTNAEFTSSLMLSIRIALVSVAIACVLGTMVSLWFWKSRGRAKAVFETIFLSPIVIPTIISAVAFLQYFALFGNLLEAVPNLCRHTNAVCYPHGHGEPCGAGYQL